LLQLEAIVVAVSEGRGAALPDRQPRTFRHFCWRWRPNGWCQLRTLEAPVTAWRAVTSRNISGWCPALAQATHGLSINKWPVHYASHIRNPEARPLDCVFSLLYQESYLSNRLIAARKEGGSIRKKGAPAGGELS